MRPHVLVVGAGMAGTATAHALANRGARVHLIDDLQRAAGSRVPLAVMAPYPTPPGDTLTRLRTLGARYTAALLNRLEREGFDSGRRGHGAVLAPATERDRRRRERARQTPIPRTTSIEPTRAWSDYGLALTEHALFHPMGCCVEPAQLIASLRRSAPPSIPIRLEHARVTRLGPHHGGWSAFDNNGTRITQADTVVVAAGPWVSELWPELAERVIPVRGQISRVRATEVSQRLSVPVSSGGFVTPCLEGAHWVGSSNDPGDSSPEPRESDDQANLHRLHSLFPPPATDNVLQRYVGIRGVTPDRLPLIANPSPGLWINTGHGAHGLMTAPLSSARLARRISRSC
jgi:tRNA 5-methylaminomethyl-2-thiouridine biosynthesis bifunctional protein